MDASGRIADVGSMSSVGGVVGRKALLRYSRPPPQVMQRSSVDGYDDATGKAYAMAEIRSAYLYDSGAQR